MGWLPSPLHTTLLCLSFHHFLSEGKQGQKTVREVGEERPQNSMTSQTWLFSLGDCDTTPALPDHAAPGGTACQFHHTCAPVCAHSLPAGPAQPMSANRGCSCPCRQPGVAYGKPSQWCDSTSAANRWARKLPLISVATLCQLAPSREAAARDPLLFP